MCAFFGSICGGVFSRSFFSISLTGVRGAIASCVRMECNLYSKWREILEIFSSPACQNDFFNFTRKQNNYFGFGYFSSL